MIEVSARMHPHGDAAKTYELLHATITNKTTPQDRGDRYFAHVVARPSAALGIPGYDADVLVTGHDRQSGLTPLLMAVLNAAHASPADRRGVPMPPAQVLGRLTLADVTAFERSLVSRR